MKAFIGSILCSCLVALSFGRPQNQFSSSADADDANSFRPFVPNDGNTENNFIFPGKTHSIFFDTFLSQK
jgi:hypothetical protein